jgi:hypothetical protein
MLDVFFATVKALRPNQQWSAWRISSYSDLGKREEIVPGADMPLIQWPCLAVGVDGVGQTRQFCAPLSSHYTETMGIHSVDCCIGGVCCRITSLKPRAFARMKGNGYGTGLPDPRCAP